MECIGQRQVGYRLENGEPFIVTWHVANVTNLIISATSLTGANIEVRHAKNESGMIMDRCGTQTSVILHKFAKVPWLKLRRDNSVVDSDPKIAAVNTKPMAIEEIGSGEQRQTSLRRKKETLGMDDTVEVLLTLGLEGSVHGSEYPVAHPVETLKAQRTAPDLVLWSDELGGLLEPAQEGKECQRKERPNWSKSGREGYARAPAHEFPRLVQLLRARWSC